MRFQPSTHSYGQWPESWAAGTSAWSAGQPLPPQEELNLELSAPQVAGIGAGVGLIILGFLVVGPLVVYPWVIKAFKPEWSYGRRVAAGLGGSIVLGAVSQIGRSK